jgi:hypothetical protein
LPVIFTPTCPEILKSGSELGDRGSFEEMGMIRLGLFAAGILLLTATFAWAFSQQIVSPDGGNYSFGDPDKRPTTSSSSQGTRPFGSSGPTVQFGVQQGPMSTFGQSNRYNTTPDPYFRSLQNGD